MAERKPLGKKIRFEVFKRDKFTCQYCGRMSPDVILEVDHIKPVAEGGDNDILNLITSCRDCNRGKGKRRLDDYPEAKKQQARIKELSDRNEQLLMLLEWRKELEKFDEHQLDTICDSIAEKWNVSFGEQGRNMVRTWIKEFSVEEVLDAFDIAFDKYYCGDNESLRDAFKKIGGICFNRRRNASGDKHTYYYNYLKKSCYSKLRFCDTDKLHDTVFNYINDDETFEQVKRVLQKARYWEDFFPVVYQMLDISDREGGLYGTI